MSLLAVLLVLILVFVLLPRQGSYNADWGFAPLGGGLGLVLIVIVILALLGHL